MLERTLILDSEAVNRKLDRMAVEMIEKYHKVGSFVVVGIAERGSHIANVLCERVAAMGGPEIIRTDAFLNKETGQVTISPNVDFNGKEIALVDDVLNTGKTLFKVAAEIMHMNPAALRTVILINRRHRKVPIRADIVGLTLSTTLQDHIHVDTQAGSMAAYLQ